MSPRSLAAIAVSASTLSAAHADIAHPYGWRVGTDGQGTILVDFIWEMAHTRWEYSQAGPMRGAIDDSLSFDEYPVEVPEAGLVPFDQPGSEIAIVFTHFDTGVYFYDPADTSTPVNTPGAVFELGTTGTTFNTDSIWQVDPTTQGFDLFADLWSVSFYFTDLTGIYADSEEYTYLLAPVLEFPSPATALVLLPALAATRRRR